MPAGTSTSPFDDVVVIRLRISRSALAGAVTLVLFALLLGAIAFQPSSAGTRTPWFAQLLLLVPAVLAVVGALLTVRGSSGRIAVGSDGVRVVSPGHGVIELRHDAILAVDEPLRPGSRPLRLGQGRRHPALALALVAPIAVLMPGDDPVRLVSTQVESFDMLVLACRHPERLRQALRTPPFRPLPKPPPAVAVRSVQALRTIAVAGAPLLAVIAGCFALGILVVLTGEVGAESAPTATQTALPPALPGYKGSFFRGEAPGGARVYVWRVRRTATVRVDSPPLDCGIASSDWDAQTGPDVAIGAGGRFHVRFTGQAPALYKRVRHEVALSVDGRVSPGAVRVAFSRADRATGPVAPDACTRSGSALARRVR